MKVEKVRGNKKEATVSCLTQLCFDEEKMRSSRGEVVFYSLKIRSKTANVAEVNKVKAEEGGKTFWDPSDRAIRPGDISGLPRRRLRGLLWSRHF
ncbi:hypothetical protein E2C01_033881 [Portunus trituberculatus]|uniref:Uncharacterized protein n=1 Tax=Portunus trituberculatus TaxID=210409 RepID=A0A5B7F3X0_PORTR|nr:hypothetical protein [Portunus trituberculatus]